MYAWLSEVLDDGAHVVTASRRLARLLTEENDRRQLESGRKAWLRPNVYDWSTWLRVLADRAPPSIERPVRISSHQSRLVWEECLAAELGDRDANLNTLVRVAREARTRLSEWLVPTASVGEYARSEDQRLFAGALNAYLRRLDRAGWADDAGLSEWVLAALASGRVDIPSLVVLAGFTSASPLVERACSLLREQGVRVSAARCEEKSKKQFAELLDEDAEFRSAGAWARQQLLLDPDQSVAVIASGLEADAGRAGRLVREGFVPGWQIASAGHEAAVNVSYGRRLADFPVVAIALLLLRWMHQPLGAADLGMLLRSRLSCAGRDDSWLKAELELREIPDRQWSIELFAAAFSRPDADTALQAFIAALDQCQRGMQKPVMSPRSFAEQIDVVLGELGWPGDASVDSVDFQVLNRWRELLNEFVRLTLVRPVMNVSQATARLSSMASETVFQPEQQGAVVNLMGPLEASGVEFDRVWICGVSNRNWPPPSRPLPLLSSRLQKDFGMPDGTPDNTADYARRSLESLAQSAGDVVFSMARYAGDVEQTVSALIPECDSLDGTALDPGWFAASMVDPASVHDLGHDTPPPVKKGDRVYGGASTLDRQAYSPFDAFAFGRLRIQQMSAFSSALSPRLRGDLIHTALQNLYADKPSHSDIVAFDAAELEARVDRSVQACLAGHFRLADDVLRQILRLEEQRIRKLLGLVLATDMSRGAFDIVEIESDQPFEYKTLHLRLRADRIDRLADAGLLVLDYKTGAEKKFLRKKEPDSLQLVLYSLTAQEPVAGLGLYNVDSRAVGIDGVGKSLDERDDWDRDLAGWSALALAHLDRLIDGDVRINAFQDIRDSRRTALLSRVAELKRDG